MRAGWRDTWQGGAGEEWKEEKDVLGEFSAIVTKTRIVENTPICLPG